MTTIRGHCEFCGDGPSCCVCGRGAPCGVFEVFRPTSMRVIFRTRFRALARAVAWLTRGDYAPRGWWHV